VSQPGVRAQTGLVAQPAIGLPSVDVKLRVEHVDHGTGNPAAARLCRAHADILERVTVAAAGSLPAVGRRVTQERGLPTNLQVRLIVA